MKAMSDLGDEYRTFPATSKWFLRLSQPIMNAPRPMANIREVTVFQEIAERISRLIWDCCVL